MLEGATPPRVLVIDDEAMIRTTLCAILTDAGCRVAAASDGVQAVEALRKDPADAVVVDIYMPQLDGFETIRQLRRVAPDAMIVAMSGGSRGEFDPLRAAELLGADRSLRKPFSVEDVLTALKDVLATRIGDPDRMETLHRKGVH
jgi:two-component system, chemotaxis family, chemotaxis protein CheY